ncbi:unnamed protein product [Candidula unifasciata]|uniref:Carboxylesterase type B domain-containing protein n=1 Tax=Candidula unifasciata TaxID=100452 RepID=A0A8S3Z0I2_9EUPU|nr:unnamed protein product [Candidula unifasciata]
MTEAQRTSSSAWLGAAILLCLALRYGVEAQARLGSRNFTDITFSDGRQLRGELVHTQPGTSNTGVVYTFLGVQYGASPTGTRRYSAPEPEPRWSGLREALNFGPRCVQSVTDWADQSENCLFLNVYSPSLNSTSPVMVWFHGGGWRVGSSSDPIFDGTSLATKGVVVVTVNYRLGALGFLVYR